MNLGLLFFPSELEDNIECANSLIIFQASYLFYNATSDTLTQNIGIILLVKHMLRAKFGMYVP